MSAATVPMVDAGTPELAEVLSPSQTSTFLQCSARWWFRYGLQLPDVQGSALALGKSLHAAERENFTQKIETKQDLPLAGVVALYRDAWAKEEDETAFEDSEDPAEIKAMGESLVTKYHEEAAPFIEPVAVELPIRGKISGVKVQGFIDLLDVNGCVIDIKSANKTPSGVRSDYRFQVTTYHALEPRARAARVDTLVKLKREVKLVQHPMDITPADERSIEVLYPLAQEGMRSGLYFPNRNSYLCARKYCPY